MEKNGRCCMAYDYSEIGCKLFYANFNGNWVYFGQYTSHEDVLYFINKQTDFEHDFGTNIVTIGYLTSYKPNIIGSDIESLINTKINQNTFLFPFNNHIL